MVNRITNLAVIGTDLFPKVPTATFNEIREQTLKHVISGGGGTPRKMSVKKNAFSLDEDDRTETYDTVLSTSIEHFLVMGIYPDALSVEPNLPRIEARLIRKDLIPAHTSILMRAGLDPNKVNLVSFDIKVTNPDGSRILISGKEAFNWCVSVTPQLIRWAKADRSHQTVYLMDIEPDSHDHKAVVNGFQNPASSLKDTLEAMWAFKRFEEKGYGKLIGITKNTFIYQGLKPEHAINFFLLPGNLENSPSSIPASVHAEKDMKVVRHTETTTSLDSALPFESES